MPSVLGNGVLLGVALAGAQFTGGTVFSQRSDPDEDKFATKEEIRRRFQRPANEMINEIGEGRGNSFLHPNVRAWRRNAIASFASSTGLSGTGQPVGISHRFSLY